MANLWTHFELSPVDLIVRGAVVYFSVLILLRISGKKQVGQMGATEFVSVLLISNAVQNSMNGGDNSLVGGVLLATVLVLLSIVISELTYRSKFFSTFFEGTPRLLIHEGKLLEESLKKELLTQSDVHTLLRKQGIQHFHEVKSAVLEADGTLSVIRHVDLIKTS